MLSLLKTALTDINHESSRKAFETSRERTRKRCGGDRDINHESSRKAFETRPRRDLLQSRTHISITNLAERHLRHQLPVPTREHVFTDINHESSRKAFETPRPRPHRGPWALISITNLAERHLRLVEDRGLGAHDCLAYQSRI